MSARVRFCRNRAVVAGIGLVACFAAGSCGQSDQSHVAAESESGSSFGSSSLPADAPIEEIASEFSKCESDSVLHADLPSLFGLTDAWIQVEGVLSADRDGDGERQTLPAVVAGVVTAGTIPADTSVEPRTYEIMIHSSYWAGIDWALDAGGDTFLAIDTSGADVKGNYVVAVLSFTKDGRLFFPGHCQQDTIGTEVKTLLGKDSDSVMRALTEVTGLQARELLARDSLPLESGNSDPILNPDTASEEMLRSLQFAAVAIRIDTPLAVDSTVCLRSSAGWNDCFVPNAEMAKNGLALDAYIAKDGVLEFWLLDSDANVRQPRGMLGSVAVPPGLVDVKEVALSVELSLVAVRDYAESAGRDLGGAALLVDSVPIGDVSNDDPAWSPFFGAKPAEERPALGEDV